MSIMQSRVLYSACIVRLNRPLQDKFHNSKTSSRFQTLTLATLGKWATTHERVFFLGQELLFDFPAWPDLTSNANNMITVYQLPSKFQNTF